MSDSSNGADRQVLVHHYHGPENDRQRERDHEQDKTHICEPPLGSRPGMTGNQAAPGSATGDAGLAKQRTSGLMRSATRGDAPPGTGAGASIIVPGTTTRSARAA
ncbi:MAG: hypothetical protein ACRC8U_06835, partial [Brooklawnia sp.]